MMPAADVSHPQQFVARPHSSGRVVRIAEQKQTGTGVGSLALQVVEVHRIGTVVVGKTVGNHLAPVVAY